MKVAFLFLLLMYFDSPLIALELHRFTHGRTHYFVATEFTFLYLYYRMPSQTLCVSAACAFTFCCILFPKTIISSPGLTVEYRGRYFPACESIFAACLQI